MKKKIVSIVAACVAICTAAGCSGGTQGSETTTTAAQTEAATTTAGTEATTTTTPKETTGDAASTDDISAIKGWWTREGNFSDEETVLAVMFMSTEDDWEENKWYIYGYFKSGTLFGADVVITDEGLSGTAEFREFKEDGTYEITETTDVKITEEGDDGVLMVFGNGEEHHLTTLTDPVSFEGTAIFNKGVWAASKDGKVDTYFVFYDEMNGTTLKADGMGGTPFTCEQNGLNVLFHFGSADDNTPAVFKAGDAEGTFDYGDGNTVTYSFEYLPDADPDTFEVPEGVNFEGTAIFTKGVWAASKDGSVDTYFVFYDEANGTTMKADGMGGTPFTCEQDGLNITFHFGSADDNTTAVFKEGDAEGTFDYGDGNVITYTFNALAKADPDKFGNEENIPYLNEAVWAVYPEDESGNYPELTEYYVFSGDEGNGKTIDAATKASTSFSFEQIDQFIVFHFGEGDNTKAFLSKNDANELICTFVDEFSTRSAIFRLLINEDPAAFDGTPVNQ